VVESYASSVKSKNPLSQVQIVQQLGGDKSNAAVLVLGPAGQKVGARFYDKTVNGNTFYASFLSLCKEITGSGVKQTILRDLDYMADYTYNWDKEAYPVRKAYRDYIQACLFHVSKLLSFCVEAYDSQMRTDLLEKSYDDAIAYMTTGAGKTVDRTPTNYKGAYCTTISKYVFMRDRDHWYKYGGTSSITVDEFRLIKERAFRLGRTIMQDINTGGLNADTTKTYDYIVTGNFEQKIVHRSGSDIDILADVCKPTEKTSLDMSHIKVGVNIREIRYTSIWKPATATYRQVYDYSFFILSYTPYE
jgi:hypothetical protein